MEYAISIILSNAFLSVNHNNKNDGVNLLLVGIKKRTLMK